ncbi:MAG: zinc ribbon domain-containing protein, partial [Anaerolineales bacterium]
MSKETLGYVRLVWVCPNCKTRNPGDQKTCSSCGSPQPENVAFEQDIEQKLLEDEKKIEQAKADADVHCGFCGTRNSATATVCVQCGGDLKEGKKRISGQIVGAFQSGGVQKQTQCPNCGEINPPNAQTCQKCGGPLAEISQPTAIPTPPVKQKRTIAIILALAALFLCGMLILLGINLFSKSELVGTVRSVGWERAIEIEQFGPVTRQGWKDEIPNDAVIGSCRKQFHHTQSEPAPDAEKVCGTPYTIDRGTGF